LEKENHKQRAYLNSITSILDHFAKQIAGFVSNPFIVKGLGPTFYGVYQIILEMSGYANMADAQATQVLKWTVAQKRGYADNEELKSEITTALIMVVFILPLVLIVGGVLSWYAPLITKVHEDYYSIVRLACAIIVFSLALDKLTNLFESLLRGLNLGFKGMGVRTVVILLGAGLKIMVVLLGYGLVGLSIVQLFLGIGTGIVFYWLVKVNLPWFGLGKTNFEKIKSYLKLSWWFMATKLAGMALFHSEKILLGFLIGPELVTIYVLTLFTSTAMKGMIDAVISGVVPGIGSFFGKGEFEKIKMTHNIINSLIWWFSFSVGISIIVFNKSFLDLWVGEGNYAGQIENLLIILIAIQHVFFFTTGNFINVTLDLKTKVYLTGIAALISILMTFILVKEYEIIGLCISVLVGRLVLTFGFPLILKRKIFDQGNWINAEMIRPFLITILGLFGSLYIEEFINIQSWLGLIFSVGFSVLTLLGIFWLIGFDRNQKNQLVEKFKTIRIFKIRD